MCVGDVEGVEQGKSGAGGKMLMHLSHLPLSGRARDSHSAWYSGHECLHPFSYSSLSGMVSEALDSACHSPQLHVAAESTFHVAAPFLSTCIQTGLKDRTLVLTSPCRSRGRFLKW